MRLLNSILILAFMLMSVISYAQPVYERPSYDIYDFLSRMAQKGFIELNDNVKPIRKDQILKALDRLATKKLSSIEKKELSFYNSEYHPGGFKNKLYTSSENFSFQALPIITGEAFTTSEGRGFKKSIGAQFYGSVGKHIGYQFSFQDITESGKGLDTSKMGVLSAQETGMVLQSQRTTTHLNYSEIRAGLTYAFKKGSFFVGQDYLQWGYGKFGQVVLSDKAPTYPYIRFDYNLTPKLHFNYTHAWLKSDILDSARSYTIPGGIFGGVREVFIPKYMASHSLDVTLSKGLHFTLGESMVYTDRVNIAYLVPVMFFKAFDNYVGSGNITRGSNGQFFFQLSSRNQIKNTHLYATLLIDEVKVSKFFNKTEQRNQLGYTIGASLADAGLSYLTIGAEYTRLRPFVYRNFLPAQNYTSSSYLLGDWLGSNADRLSLYANYTPKAQWRVSAKFQHIRKGSAGTLDQQYFQQPQAPFLFGTVTSYNDLSGRVSYQPIPRLFLFGSIRSLNSQSILSLGLNFGL